MAFSRAGASGNDKPLFSIYKIQSGQFHNLLFVDARLEVEVKIGKEFTFRQFGFFDTTFDTPFDESHGFALKKLLQNPGYLGFFRCSLC
jgi:hypothetical protein